jgi:general secretion pathway protein A
MYESFYGFSAKPFQLTPDPAFFYGSRGHRRAMSYLEYGLHQGEGFIVVTGDIGAGKTTILRSMLGRIPSDKIVAAQIVSTQLDADDLVRLVARAFALPDARGDKAAVLHRLERFFVDLLRRGKRALLIVDEAQNLTPAAVEELRMFSNIQIGNQAPVQSFLVGQPEFRTMMQGPSMQQLRQRVIASYHLGPLEADETAGYVEHRLKHVGWTGDNPAIDPQVYQRIHAATGGIPRQINALMDRVLLAGYLGESRQIGVDDAQVVIDELAQELGNAGVVPGATHTNGYRQQPVAAESPQMLEDLAVMREKLVSLESMMRKIYNALGKKSAPAKPAANGHEHDAGGAARGGRAGA